MIQAAPINEAFTSWQFWDPVFKSCDSEGQDALKSLCFVCCLPSLNFTYFKILLNFYFWDWAESLSRSKIQDGRYGHYLEKTFSSWSEIQDGHHTYHLENLFQTSFTSSTSADLSETCLKWSWIGCYFSGWSKMQDGRLF